MTANKNDVKDRKPAIEYLHPKLILGVGLVMRAGELKYGGWNFIKGLGRLRLIAAAMRHLLAMMAGEDIDKDCTERLGETVYHWDCVVANMNMFIFMRERGTLIDDGPKEETSTEKYTTFSRDARIEDINKFERIDRVSLLKVGDLIIPGPGDAHLSFHNKHTLICKVSAIHVDGGIASECVMSEDRGIIGVYRYFYNPLLFKKVEDQ